MCSYLRYQKFDYFSIRNLRVHNKLSIKVLKLLCKVFPTHHLKRDKLFKAFNILEKQESLNDFPVFYNIGFPVYQAEL